MSASVGDPFSRLLADVAFSSANGDTAPLILIPMRLLTGGNIEYVVLFDFIRTPEAIPKEICFQGW
jgi:hypothetical protein